MPSDEPGDSERRKDSALHDPKSGRRLPAEQEWKGPPKDENERDARAEPIPTPGEPAGGE